MLIRISFASSGLGRSVLISLICLLVTSLQSLTTLASNNIGLQLPRKHQFQFEGDHADLHKGFYRQAGLGVDIIEGRIDAISNHDTNEPWQLKHLRLETTIISSQSYGVDFYSDALSTSTQKVEKHPTRGKMILDASLRGWKYGLSHTGEMIDPDFSFDGFFYEPEATTKFPWLKITWSAGITFIVAVFIGAGIISKLKRKLTAGKAPRHRMAADHKNNEERLRNIIEHSSDLFYSHTTAHQFTYLSPQCRAFFDCEPEEAMTNWTEFITDNPINKKGFEATEKAIRTGKRQPPYELELKSKKGRIFRVEVHESPVLKNGKTETIVGIATDITERHHTEKALQESEEKYRRIFQHSVVGFFQSTPEGRFTAVNPAFAGILGYQSPQQLVASISDISSQYYANPDDRRRYQRALKKKGYVENFEFEVQCKDGSRKWVSNSTRAYLDGDGKTIYYEGIVIDITQRKIAETLLQESEAHFRFLTNNMADIVWTTDLDFQTTYMSPSAEKMLGFSEEERKSQSLAGKMTPESAERSLTLLTTELEKDQKKPELDRTFTIETECYKKDGSTFWLENKVKWVRDADGTIVGIHGVSRDISERRQSLSALRESEERYRGVVEDIPGLICCFLPSGEITFVNNNYCEYFTKSPQELIGSNIQSLIHGSDGESVMTNIRMLTIDSPIQSHEHQVISPNGDITWQRWTNRALFDSQGKVVSYQAIGEDITVQKRIAMIQKAQYNIANAMVTAVNLEESFTIIKEELAELIDVNQLFLFLYDQKSDLQRPLYSEDENDTTSDAWKLAKFLSKRVKQENKPFLLSSEEIKALAQKDKIDITDKITEVWLGLPLFSGEKFIGTLVLQNDDHAGVHGETTIKMLEQVSRDLGNYIDRKLLENDREQMIAAIEQTGEDVIITDVEGTIEYVNPVFEKITGYSSSEAIGQNPRILKSGKQDDLFYQNLWETISSGKTWRGKIINRTKEGHLITEDATISPVFDKAGKIVNYVAVKRDITRQIRIHKEKTQLQEQLQQAQKVEAIGRLAGGIAHDFNNMLSIILGYGESLLDQLHTGDPMREDVKEIMEAGRRSAALTRQLLAFSRKQTLQPTVLNLNDIILNLEKMLGRLIGEDIELNLSLAENLGLVMADPGQIEQVIMNISVNARDAMPMGGKLIIESTNVELDRIYADDHPSVIPGRYAMVAITDTGFGMDNDTLSKVFEPFFTTKIKGRGTGLGLSTVYGIVKQSGGNIWVYSERGHGTSFKVYLPIIDAEKTIEKKSPKRDNIQGHGEQIIVVEDEKSVRRLMVKVLTKLNYQVKTAANGGEALLLIEEAGLEPDLVITDVIMPGVGGAALIKRLKKTRPELKVLYMSGYTDDAIVHHGILGPDTPFIQKPFSIREIIAKVQEVLHR